MADRTATAATGSQTSVVIAPGHFGRLDDAQQAAFDQFKAQVETKYGRSGAQHSWYNDVTLLRFLRARRFSVVKAMQQFAVTDSWRKEMDLERIFRTASGEELHHSKRHYPRFLGRRDRQGRPIFVYRPGSLTSERQREIFSVDEKRRFERIAILTESMNRLYLPLASHILEQEHPISAEQRATEPRIISEVTSIIDFDGASLSMLWMLRNHLKQASVLTSSHYPETLGTMALVNVPSSFAVIWGWLQKWFDEGTRKKIVIVSGQQLEDGALCEIVAAQNLPRIYGGELDWRYEDEPDCDEAICRAIGHEQVPDAPSEWSDGRLIIFDESERKRYTQTMKSPEEDRPIDAVQHAMNSKPHALQARSDEQNV